jgi:outer membrane protein assembly factor BamB
VRRAAALAVVAAALGAAAPARAAITPATVTALRPAWSLHAGGAIHGASALSGGTLYVPSEDGDVYAVDAATGAQRWAFRTGGPVWSTPAVADGTVVVGSTDDRVYALDARTGRERWRFATGSDVVSSPAVAGGLVYVGSDDHRVYALSLRTGRVRWAFTTGDRASGSPVVAGGTVYTGSNDGRLYALDAATGAKRWSYAGDAWVWAAPAVAGGRVYFTTTGSAGALTSNGSGGRLYALDAATGALDWQTDGAFNGLSSPVVDGGQVVATSYAAVEAFDAATGASRWTHTVQGLIGPFLLGSPAVAGGIAYAVVSDNDGSGSVLALDAATGDVLRQVGFPRVDYAYGAPVLDGDRLVLGGGDGTLHGLALDPRAPVAREARPVPSKLAPYSAHRDVLGDMLDPDSVTELREPGDGVAKAATSGDPTGRNTDATVFHGVTGGGRRVLLDVSGAGVLTDLYLYDNAATAPSGALGPPACPPDPGGLNTPKLAIYLDDSPTPLFDMNAAKFFCGGAGFPFVAPLVGFPAGAQTSHVPIPFRRHLRVVATPARTQNLFWYDLYYTKFPDARGVRSFDPVRDRARYQALIDRWSRSGQDPRPPDAATRVVRGNATIAPGQIATLLDAAGGGEVTAVRLRQFTADPPVVTTPAARDGEPLQATRIRARFDGHAADDVDAPVGDFFGTGFGQAEDYDTLVAGMHTRAGSLPPGWPHPSEGSLLGKPGGVSTYAYWPMPFGHDARITLANTLPAGSSTVQVAYEIDYRPGGVRVDAAHRLWRGDSELGYFHATPFANRRPKGNSPHPDRDANDLIARIAGRGNYAGHVLDMRNDTFGKGVDDLHYLEGDCMFWVDGAPDYEPDVTSTGHEECHDTTGPYFQWDTNNPTAGVTERDVCGTTIFCTTTGESSVFRWWLGDTIAFQKRFEATIEHGDENTYDGSPTNPGARADESGVAFYYLGG